MLFTSVIFINLEKLPINCCELTYPPRLINKFLSDDSDRTLVRLLTSLKTHWWLFIHRKWPQWSQTYRNYKPGVPNLPAWLWFVSSLPDKFRALSHLFCFSLDYFDRCKYSTLTQVHTKYVNHPQKTLQVLMYFQVNPCSKQPPSRKGGARKEVNGTIIRPVRRYNLITLWRYSDASKNAFCIALTCHWAVSCLKS